MMGGLARRSAVSSPASGTVRQLRASCFFVSPAILSRHTFSFMNFSHLFGCARLVSLMLAASSLTAAEPTVRPLWPDKPPGELAARPPESDVTTPSDRRPGGRRVIRISNVSTPTITIYKPEAARDTGAAVLVCPGGGYVRLAMDIEGTEVCEWLNSIGVTGILLKYRVFRWRACCRSIEREQGSTTLSGNRCCRAAELPA